MPTHTDRPPLQRQPDFVKFWTAVTVSLLGSQVTVLALPLIAVQLLSATPAQMGILRALHALTAGALGLFAGILVDRLRRRRLLIGTDLAFAAVAATVATTAMLGVLNIRLLFAIQILSGALTIVAEVANMAFLPSLAGRDRLVAANSRLQTTLSAVAVAGPGIAGLLITRIGAPAAMLVDAASFAISAVLLSTIRAPEPSHRPPATDPHASESLWDQLGEGIRTVYGHPWLKPVAQMLMLHFFFSGIISSQFVLYLVRELGLSPVQLGGVFAALGGGLLAGALVAGPVARAAGLGAVVVGGSLLYAVGNVVLPVASGSPPAVTLIVAAGQFVVGLGIQVNSINLMSLRQGITPNHLQGRMNATFRSVNLVALSAGALTGGLLGSTMGLRLTLAVGALGLVVPVLRLALSPILALKEQPQPV
jgi:MFS family permease